MDKYDMAIAYFTQHPHRIKEYWNCPSSDVGCLFQYLNAKKDIKCGCLTEVKAGCHDACSEELTREIREDDRIPDHPDKIRVEDLPVFAEYQRKLDKLFPSRS